MKTKTRTRPLLLASAGLSVITVAAGCITSGNLIVQPCQPDGGYDCTDQGEDPADGGTDGGTTPTDGGADAGDGGL